MSKRDQRQLFAIYGVLILVIIASMLVWKGTFGEPKYTKDTNANVPNWFTEQEYAPYEFKNMVDSGAISVQGIMPETAENMPKNQNQRTDLKLVTTDNGVRQDVGNSTTDIPNY